MPRQPEREGTVRGRVEGNSQARPRIFRPEFRLTRDWVYDGRRSPEYDGAPLREALPGPWGSPGAHRDRGESRRHAQGRRAVSVTFRLYTSPYKED